MRVVGYTLMLRWTGWPRQARSVRGHQFTIMANVNIITRIVKPVKMVNCQGDGNAQDGCHHCGLQHSGPLSSSVPPFELLEHAATLLQWLRA